MMPIYFGFVVWPLYAHYRDGYTRRILYFLLMDVDFLFMLLPPKM